MNRPDGVEMVISSFPSFPGSVWECGPGGSAFQIQRIDDDVRQRGYCEQGEPVEGAAGEEVGFAVFYRPVRASSHGSIHSMLLAENESQPMEAECKIVLVHSIQLYQGYRFLLKEDQSLSK
jgi:hypothetical protein